MNVYRRRKMNTITVVYWLSEIEMQWTRKMIYNRQEAIWWAEQKKKECMKSMSKKNSCHLMSQVSYTEDEKDYRPHQIKYIFSYNKNSLFFVPILKEIISYLIFSIAGNEYFSNVWQK